jgi:hypothetical protein
MPRHDTHATRTTTDAPPRLVRVRRMAWLLDSSIPVGNFRIGLDPLIGLVPWIGDVFGAGMSTIILYDAARLGIPVHILLKMVGNILVEVVIGTVPLVGDLFDFAWRANVRNLRLIERHYTPVRQERPARRIARAVAVLGAVAIVGALALSFVVLRALWVLIRDFGVGAA